MIFSGFGLVLCILLPESYAPALLRNKTAKIRKETGDSRWWCRYDETLSLIEILKINLKRPFVMACTEPIWYDRVSQLLYSPLLSSAFFQPPLALALC